MQKELYSAIFNHKPLRTKVFQDVLAIDKQIDPKGKKYTYEALWECPAAMAGNGYKTELEKYFTDNPLVLKDLTRKDLNDIFRATVKAGHLEILKYLVGAIDREHRLLGTSTIMKESRDWEIIHYIESLESVQVKYECAMSEAPLTGDIERLKYFAGKCRVSRESIAIAFNNAARVGRIDMIEWLAANYSKYRAFNSMTIEAVRGGHLHVLEYLKKEAKDRFTFEDDDELSYLTLIDVSAEFGHLDILKWLHYNRIGFATSRAAYLAATKGHLELLKYLLNHVNTDFSSDAMDYACSKHLDIVKWLHENQSARATTLAMDNAAMNGRFEIVKWLNENRSEGCTQKAMDQAAGGGFLEIVVWLHENRSEGCTTDAMDIAAQNGHLHVVKWLHENRSEGCSTRAMDYACFYKRSEVVKWLHENRSEGCTKKAMENASYFGDLRMVKWLHENRTEGCSKKAMDNAASSGSLETLIWLHENRSEGCSTHAMNTAASNGHLSVLEWLHENRSEGCTTRAMDDAIICHHMHILKWLHENRTEGCTEEGINYAHENDYKEVINWLSINKPKQHDTPTEIHVEEEEEEEDFGGDALGL
ncbi:hypothetical protein PPL_06031 [Heterostelium album PN500]|uniref:Ankyrin repeat protein n=1 Tax=Heterostelium pallidum (strain ATCC 26659 / Pp 5 / PN500) TaxID=670386 RepID=D3BC11_HETP5|nr:hypothetical protein PPL_06031 [Heterostelium album PN500]EFA81194.1 hypothetical protein PPL_06031 [Heterostelium album PN500]|eukprot:XP_020433312.1 hypothetical protein PPL_06031 [Heterostelium album PN500]